MSEIVYDKSLENLKKLRVGMSILWKPLYEGDTKIYVVEDIKPCNLMYSNFPCKKSGCQGYIVINGESKCCINTHRGNGNVNVKYTPVYSIIEEFITEGDFQI